MKILLDKLHARLGDFWWYSLMIFMAARAADALNVFVGLWLVPKYVPASELGAVQPLMQFANFLAVPAAVFASTFRQELTGLAVNREFSKMKTLMRSVFITTAVFFFLAIAVCHFLLPHFLTRIRVAEGSLGLLILIASFLSVAQPVYTNALQAMKRFREYSLIHVLCAPIRLITMIAAMPFRALSGYFVGQASTPAFTIAASVWSLRKDLAVKAEPYWTRDIVRRFSGLFAIFLASSTVGGIVSLVESMVLRQRIPEIESAAYYMVTRFSDIAGFLAITLTFTIFPYAAELAAKGQDTNTLVLKSSLAVLATNLPLAAFFWLLGRPILEFLPNGALYADYYWAIPWMIGIVSIMQISGFYMSGEIAANRFGYMWWSIPLNAVYALAMLLVSGYGYFTACLPSGLNDFLAAHNLTSLSAMLWWMTAFRLTHLFGCLAHIIWRRRKMLAK